MIRLYIIDDHSIIIDGIRQWLRHQQDGITITGSSDNIENFVQSTLADSFDIIILDLWLPGQDPVDNIKLIGKHFPGKPVVIFTQETSNYWIRVMMENGVRAFMLKSAGRREFTETIEKVFGGKTILPLMTQDDNSTLAGTALLSQQYFLKPSEREIVVRVSKGESLKSIATDRSSTVSAIEKTLKKIRDKFGVSNNPELIRVLMDRRLI